MRGEERLMSHAAGRPAARVPRVVRAAMMSVRVRTLRTPGSRRLRHASAENDQTMGWPRWAKEAATVMRSGAANQRASHERAGARRGRGFMDWRAGLGWARRIRGGTMGR